MVLCSLILSALISIQDGPKSYANPLIGLSFQYPQTWQMSIKKGVTSFKIPSEATSKYGVLEIYAIPYRLKADDWQAMQLSVNKNLKRTVERQWQEEILSVPMLLTRISYVVGAEPTVTTIGLLYSANARKMNFRLTAPADTFDAVDTQWHEALQTLRTSTGQIPQAEDPNSKPPVDPPKTTTKPTKPVVLAHGAHPNSKQYRGKTAVGAKAGGRPVNLIIPDGWRSSVKGDGFTLTTDKLSNAVSVEISSVLDSPPPLQALQSAAGKTLVDFVKVVRRDDSPIIKTSAGMDTGWVRREGQGASGEIVVVHAFGALNDYYWTLSYRANSKAVYLQDKRLLDELIDRLAVEATK